LEALFKPLLQQRLLRLVKAWYDLSIVRSGGMPYQSHSLSPIQLPSFLIAVSASILSDDVLF